jgi:hypothetical protein
MVGETTAPDPQSPPIAIETNHYLPGVVVSAQRATELPSPSMASAPTPSGEPILHARYAIKYLRMSNLRIHAIIRLVDKTGRLRPFSIRECLSFE